MLLISPIFFITTLVATARASEVELDLGGLENGAFDIVEFQDGSLRTKRITPKMGISVKAVKDKVYSMWTALSTGFRMKSFEIHQRPGHYDLCHLVLSDSHPSAKEEALSQSDPAQQTTKRVGTFENLFFTRRNKVWYPLSQSSFTFLKQKMSLPESVLDLGGVSDNLATVSRLSDFVTTTFVLARRWSQILSVEHNGEMIWRSPSAASASAAGSEAPKEGADDDEKNLRTLFKSAYLSYNTRHELVLVELTTTVPDAPPKGVDGGKPLEYRDTTSYFSKFNRDNWVPVGVDEYEYSLALLRKSAKKQGDLKLDLKSLPTEATVFSINAYSYNGVDVKVYAPADTYRLKKVLDGTSVLFETRDHYIQDVYHYTHRGGEMVDFVVAMTSRGVATGATMFKTFKKEGHVWVPLPEDEYRHMLQMPETPLTLYLDGVDAQSIARGSYKEDGVPLMEMRPFKGYHFSTVTDSFKPLWTSKRFLMCKKVVYYNRGKHFLSLFLDDKLKNKTVRLYFEKKGDAWKEITPAVYDVLFTSVQIKIGFDFNLETLILSSSSEFARASSDSEWVSPASEKPERSDSDLTPEKAITNEYKYRGVKMVSVRPSFYSNLEKVREGSEVIWRRERGYNCLSISFNDSPQPSLLRVASSNESEPFVLNYYHRKMGQWEEISYKEYDDYLAAMGPSEGEKHFTLNISDLKPSNKYTYDLLYREVPSAKLRPLEGYDPVTLVDGEHLIWTSNNENGKGYETMLSTTLTPHDEPKFVLVVSRTDDLLYSNCYVNSHHFPDVLTEDDWSKHSDKGSGPGESKKGKDRKWVKLDRPQYYYLLNSYKSDYESKEVILDLVDVYNGVTQPYYRFVNSQYMGLKNFGTLTFTSTVFNLALYHRGVKIHAFKNTQRPLNVVFFPSDNPTDLFVSAEETGLTVSTHYVRDGPAFREATEEEFMKGFEKFMSPKKQVKLDLNEFYTIVADYEASTASSGPDYTKLMLRSHMVSTMLEKYPMTKMNQNPFSWVVLEHKGVNFMYLKLNSDFVLDRVVDGDSLVTTCKFFDSFKLYFTITGTPSLLLYHRTMQSREAKMLAFTKGAQGWQLVPEKYDLPLQVMITFSSKPLSVDLYQFHPTSGSEPESPAAFARHLEDSERGVKLVTHTEPSAHRQTTIQPKADYLFNTLYYDNHLVFAVDSFTNAARPEGQEMIKSVSFHPRLRPQLVHVATLRPDGSEHSFYYYLEREVQGEVRHLKLKELDVFEYHTRLEALANVNELALDVTNCRSNADYSVVSEQVGSTDYYLVTPNQDRDLVLIVQGHTKVWESTGTERVESVLLYPKQHPTLVIAHLADKTDAKSKRVLRLKLNECLNTWAPVTKEVALDELSLARHAPRPFNLNLEHFVDDTVDFMGGTTNRYTLSRKTLSGLFFTVLTPRPGYDLKELKYKGKVVFSIHNIAQSDEGEGSSSDLNQVLSVLFGFGPQSKLLKVTYLRNLKVMDAYFRRAGEDWVEVTSTEFGQAVYTFKRFSLTPVVLDVEAPNPAHFTELTPAPAPGVDIDSESPEALQPMLRRIVPKEGFHISRVVTNHSEFVKDVEDLLQTLDVTHTVTLFGSDDTSVLYVEIANADLKLLRVNYIDRNDFLHLKKAHFAKRTNYEAVTEQEFLRLLNFSSVSRLLVYNLNFYFRTFALSKLHSMGYYRSRYEESVETVYNDSVTFVTPKQGLDLDRVMDKKDLVWTSSVDDEGVLLAMHPQNNPTTVMVKSKNTLKKEVTTVYLKKEPVEAKETPVFGGAEPSDTRWTLSSFREDPLEEEKSTLELDINDQIERLGLNKFTFERDGVFTTVVVPKKGVSVRALYDNHTLIWKPVLRNDAADKLVGQEGEEELVKFYVTPSYAPRILVVYYKDLEGVVRLRDYRKPHLEWELAFSRFMSEYLDMLESTTVVNIYAPVDETRFTHSTYDISGFNVSTLTPKKNTDVIRVVANKTKVDGTLVGAEQVLWTRGQSEHCFMLQFAPSVDPKVLMVSHSNDKSFRESKLFFKDKIDGWRQAARSTYDVFTAKLMELQNAFDFDLSDAAPALPSLNYELENTEISGVGFTVCAPRPNRRMVKVMDGWMMVHESTSDERILDVLYTEDLVMVLFARDQGAESPLQKLYFAKSTVWSSVSEDEFNAKIGAKAMPTHSPSAPKQDLNALYEKALSKLQGQEESLFSHLKTQLEQRRAAMGEESDLEPASERLEFKLDLASPDDKHCTRRDYVEATVPRTVLALKSGSYLTELLDNGEALYSSGLPGSESEERLTHVYFAPSDQPKVATLFFRANKSVRALSFVKSTRWMPFPTAEWDVTNDMTLLELTNNLVLDVHAESMRFMNPNLYKKVIVKKDVTYFMRIELREVRQNVVRVVYGDSTIWDAKQSDHFTHLELYPIHNPRFVRIFADDDGPLHFRRYVDKWHSVTDSGYELSLDMYLSHSSIDFVQVDLSDPAKYDASSSTFTSHLRTLHKLKFNTLIPNGHYTVSDVFYKPEGPESAPAKPFTFDLAVDNASSEFFDLEVRDWYGTYVYYAHVKHDANLVKVVEGNLPVFENETGIKVYRFMYGPVGNPDMFALAFSDDDDVVLFRFYAKEDGEWRRKYGLPEPEDRLYPLYKALVAPTKDQDSESVSDESDADSDSDMSVSSYDTFVPVKKSKVQRIFTATTNEEVATVSFAPVNDPSLALVVYTSAANIQMPYEGHQAAGSSLGPRSGEHGVVASDYSYMSGVPSDVLDQDGMELIAPFYLATSTNYYYKEDGVWYMADAASFKTRCLKLADEIRERTSPFDLNLEDLSFNADKFVVEPEDFSGAMFTRITPAKGHSISRVYQYNKVIYREGAFPIVSFWIYPDQRSRFIKVGHQMSETLVNYYYFVSYYEVGIMQKDYPTFKSELYEYINKKRTYVAPVHPKHSRPTLVLYGLTTTQLTVSQESAQLTLTPGHKFLYYFDHAKSETSAFSFNYDTNSLEFKDAFKTFSGFVTKLSYHMAAPNPGFRVTKVFHDQELVLDLEAGEDGQNGEVKAVVGVPKRNPSYLMVHYVANEVKFWSLFNLVDGAWVPLRHSLLRHRMKGIVNLHLSSMYPELYNLPQPFASFTYGKGLGRGTPLKSYEPVPAQVPGFSKADKLTGLFRNATASLPDVVLLRGNFTHDSQPGSLLPFTYDMMTGLFSSDPEYLFRKFYYEEEDEHRLVLLDQPGHFADTVTVNGKTVFDLNNPETYLPLDKEEPHEFKFDLDSNAPESDDYTTHTEDFYNESYVVLRVTDRSWLRSVAQGALMAWEAGSGERAKTLAYYPEHNPTRLFLVVTDGVREYTQYLVKNADDGVWRPYDLASGLTSEDPFYGLEQAQKRVETRVKGLLLTPALSPFKMHVLYSFNGVEAYASYIKVEGKFKPLELSLTDSVSVRLKFVTALVRSDSLTFSGSYPSSVDIKTKFVRYKTTTLVHDSLAALKWFFVHSPSEDRKVYIPINRFKLTKMAFGKHQLYNYAHEAKTVEAVLLSYSPRAQHGPAHQPELDSVTVFGADLANQKFRTTWKREGSAWVRASLGPDDLTTALQCLKQAQNLSPSSSAAAAAVPTTPASTADLMFDNFLGMTPETRPTRLILSGSVKTDSEGLSMTSFFNYDLYENEMRIFHAPLKARFYNHKVTDDWLNLNIVVVREGYRAYLLKNSEDVLFDLRNSPRADPAQQESIKAVYMTPTQNPHRIYLHVVAPGGGERYVYLLKSLETSSAPAYGSSAGTGKWVETAMSPVHLQYVTMKFAEAYAAALSLKLSIYSHELASHRLADGFASYRTLRRFDYYVNTDSTFKDVGYRGMFSHFDLDTGYKVLVPFRSNRVYLVSHGVDTLFKLDSQFDRVSAVYLSPPVTPLLMVVLVEDEAGNSSYSAFAAKEHLPRVGTVPDTKWEEASFFDLDAQTVIGRITEALESYERAYPLLVQKEPAEHAPAKYSLELYLSGVYYDTELNATHDFSWFYDKRAPDVAHLFVEDQMVAKRNAFHVVVRDTTAASFLFVAPSTPFVVTSVVLGYMEVFEPDEGSEFVSMVVTPLENPGAGLIQFRDRLGQLHYVFVVRAAHEWVRLSPQNLKHDYAADWLRFLKLKSYSEMAEQELLSRRTSFSSHFMHPHAPGQLEAKSPPMEMSLTGVVTDDGRRFVYFYNPTKDSAFVFNNRTIEERPGVFRVLAENTVYRSLFALALKRANYRVTSMRFYGQQMLNLGEGSEFTSLTWAPFNNPSSLMITVKENGSERSYFYSKRGLVWEPSVEDGLLSFYSSTLLGLQAVSSHFDAPSPSLVTPPLLDSHLPDPLRDRLEVDLYLSGLHDLDSFIFFYDEDNLATAYVFHEEQVLAKKDAVEVDFDEELDMLTFTPRLPEFVVTTVLAASQLVLEVDEQSMFMSLSLTPMADPTSMMVRLKDANGEFIYYYAKKDGKWYHTSVVAYDPLAETPLKADELPSSSSGSSGSGSGPGHLPTPPEPEEAPFKFNLDLSEDLATNANYTYQKYSTHGHEYGLVKVRPVKQLQRLLDGQLMVWNNDKEVRVARVGLLPPQRPDHVCLGTSHLGHHRFFFFYKSGGEWFQYHSKDQVPPQLAQLASFPLEHYFKGDDHSSHAAKHDGDKAHATKGEHDGLASAPHSDSDITVVSDSDSEEFIVEEVVAKYSTATLDLSSAVSSTYDYEVRVVEHQGTTAARALLHYSSNLTLVHDGDELVWRNPDDHKVMMFALLPHPNPTLFALSYEQSGFSEYYRKESGKWARVYLPMETWLLNLAEGTPVLRDFDLDLASENATNESYVLREFYLAGETYMLGFVESDANLAKAVDGDLPVFTNDKKRRVYRFVYGPPENPDAFGLGFTPDNKPEFNETYFKQNGVWKKSQYGVVDPALAARVQALNAALAQDPDQLSDDESVEVLEVTLSSDESDAEGDDALGAGTFGSEALARVAASKPKYSMRMHVVFDLVLDMVGDFYKTRYEMSLRILDGLSFTAFTPRPGIRVSQITHSFKVIYELLEDEEATRVSIYPRESPQLMVVDLTAGYVPSDGQDGAGAESKTMNFVRKFVMLDGNWVLSEDAFNRKVRELAGAEPSFSHVDLKVLLPATKRGEHDFDSHFVTKEALTDGVEMLYLYGREGHRVVRLTDGLDHLWVAGDRLSFLETLFLVPAHDPELLFLMTSDYKMRYFAKSLGIWREVDEGSFEHHFSYYSGPETALNLEHVTNYEHEEGERSVTFEHSQASIKLTKTKYDEQLLTGTMKTRGVTFGLVSPRKNFEGAFNRLKYKDELVYAFKNGEKLVQLYYHPFEVPSMVSLAHSNAQLPTQTRAPTDIGDVLDLMSEVRTGGDEHSALKVPGVELKHFVRSANKSENRWFQVDSEHFNNLFDLNRYASLHGLSPMCTSELTRPASDHSYSSSSSAYEKFTFDLALDTESKSPFHLRKLSKNDDYYALIVHRGFRMTNLYYSHRTVYTPADGELVLDLYYSLEPNATHVTVKSMTSEDGALFTNFVYLERNAAGDWLEKYSFKVPAKPAAAEASEGHEPPLQEVELEPEHPAGAEGHDADSEFEFDLSRDVATTEKYVVSTLGESDGVSVLVQDGYRLTRLVDNFQLLYESKEDTIKSIYYTPADNPAYLTVRYQTDSGTSGGELELGFVYFEKTSGLWVRMKMYRAKPGVHDEGYKYYDLASDHSTEAESDLSDYSDLYAELPYDHPELSELAETPLSPLRLFTYDLKTDRESSDYFDFSLSSVRGMVLATVDPHEDARMERIVELTKPVWTVPGDRKCLKFSYAPFNEPVAVMAAHSAVDSTNPYDFDVTVFVKNAAGDWDRVTLPEDPKAFDFVDYVRELTHSKEAVSLVVSLDFGDMVDKLLARTHRPALEGPLVESVTPDRGLAHMSSYTVTGSWTVTRLLDDHQLVHDIPMESVESLNLYADQNDLFLRVSTDCMGDKTTHFYHTVLEAAHSAEELPDVTCDKFDFDLEADHETDEHCEVRRVNNGHELVYVKVRRHHRLTLLHEGDHALWQQGGDRYATGFAYLPPRGPTHLCLGVYHLNKHHVKYIFYYKEDGAWKLYTPRESAALPLAAPNELEALYFALTASEFSYDLSEDAVSTDHYDVLVSTYLDVVFALVTLKDGSALTDVHEGLLSVWKSRGTKRAKKFLYYPAGQPKYFTVMYYEPGSNAPQYDYVNKNLGEWVPVVPPTFSSPVELQKLSTVASAVFTKEDLVPKAPALHLNALLSRRLDLSKFEFDLAGPNHSTDDYELAEKLYNGYRYVLVTMRHYHLLTRLVDNDQTVWSNKGSTYATKFAYLPPKGPTQVYMQLYCMKAHRLYHRFFLKIDGVWKEHPGKHLPHLLFSLAKYVNLHKFSYDVGVKNYAPHAQKTELDNGRVLVRVQEPAMLDSLQVNGTHVWKAETAYEHKMATGFVYFPPDQPEYISLAYFNGRSGPYVDTYRRWGDIWLREMTPTDLKALLDEHTPKVAPGYAPAVQPSEKMPTVGVNGIARLWRKLQTAEFYNKFLHISLVRHYNQFDLNSVPDEGIYEGKDGFPLGHPIRVFNPLPGNHVHSIVQGRHTVWTCAHANEHAVSILVTYRSNHLDPRLLQVYIKNRDKIALKFFKKVNDPDRVEWLEVTEPQYVSKYDELVALHKSESDQPSAKRDPSLSADEPKKLDFDLNMYTGTSPYYNVKVQGDYVFVLPKGRNTVQRVRDGSAKMSFEGTGGSTGFLFFPRESPGKLLARVSGDPTSIAYFVKSGGVWVQSPNPEMSHELAMALVTLDELLGTQPSPKPTLRPELPSTLTVSDDIVVLVQADGASSPFELKLSPDSKSIALFVDDEDPTARLYLPTPGFSVKKVRHGKFVFYSDEYSRNKVVALGLSLDSNRLVLTFEGKDSASGPFLHLGFLKNSDENALSPWSPLHLSKSDSLSLDHQVQDGQDKLNMERFRTQYLS